MSEPITIEQEFAAPLNLLWKAITSEAEMRQWYFEQIQSFVPEVGFETQFDVECEGKVYTHCWRITEVIPDRKIAYTWRYEGYQGDSLVVWELSEVNGKTHLHLTHSGGETFPQDNPIFSRESGVAGWNYLIHDSLKQYLETNSN